MTEQGVNYRFELQCQAFHCNARHPKLTLLKETGYIFCEFQEIAIFFPFSHYSKTDLYIYFLNVLFLTIIVNFIVYCYCSHIKFLLKFTSLNCDKTVKLVF